MVFQYYPETDMLYIKLTEAVSTESEEVSPGVVLDFDAANQVVGVEIEGASQLVDLSRLELLALPIGQLVWRETTAVAV
jgi:uncharacterized protein YuzE